MQRDRLSLLLLPLAALLAILPLLLHGCSCGHDFDFHLLSWMEAARQFTHGNLHPHWAYSAAWNAGEPRFVFYPPASWTIGALLGLVLPWTWTPIVYTWLALTASGVSLYYLARDFASPPAALFAAVLYTVNPYMLFTAYERTAYAELLAAAWIPLLLHAILRREVTIPRIAIPVALLWLTNAPAAVLSCYALALLTILRLLQSEQSGSTGTGTDSDTASGVLHPDQRTLTPGHSATSSLLLARNVLAGTALGLGVAAFYIVPAAWERRFVQIAMALVPGMRIQDNFLFHHTSDLDHDNVLHTASLLAVLLLAATITALTIAWFRRQQRPNPTLVSLALLTGAIALLLTPVSAVLWRYTPELAFLQFPWRLLALLAAILCLAVALCLRTLRLKLLPTAILVSVLAAALVYPAYTVLHQSCDPEDTVSARLALFHSNHGSEPTDEYTPTTADNDSLAQSNPAFWLSPDANAKAPQGNPDSLTSAPSTGLTIHSPVAQNLILNLRDYPAWQVLLNGAPVAARVQRDDGLLALPVPAGVSTLHLAYAQTPDQTVGDLLTLLSLLTLLLLLRSAKPSRQP